MNFSEILLIIFIISSFSECGCKSNEEYDDDEDTGILYKIINGFR